MAASKKRKTSEVGPNRAVTPFANFLSKSPRLPRRFNAVVGRDAQNKPSWFLFDLLAFWEFICRLDEQLGDSLPEKEYEKVSLGGMIDALEREWPFSKEFMDHIQKEYEQALQDVKKGNGRPL